MSTNKRKRFSKAPLANFTSNTKHRKIIVNKNLYPALSNKLNAIMNDVNKTIQELSFYVEDRNIPFIIASMITYNNYDLDDSRIVLLPAGNTYPLPFSKAERYNNSHCIEFQLSALYKQITFSNSSCDAKLVIDENYLIPATTDLFLDSAMFNSYSFLRDMSIDEKRTFSKQKFEFFKNRNLNCYYTYDKTDILLYYSLAFSARKSSKEIDIPLYISLWNEFLQTYYPGALHREPSLESQLNNHIDRGQLPINNIIENLKSKPPGSYLFVKLNKQPHSSQQATELLTILGGSVLTFGSWTIIPTNEYYRIKEYVQRQHLSAFKIVNL